MALITSAASGNFNAGATWTGGIVPTVGDEARAATGHTITITANATCDEVSNAGTGIFTLNDGVTLTANVTHKSATTTRVCLQFTAASPAAGTIVGNVTGGSASDAIGASIGTTGTLNIIGNVTGGTGASFAFGAQNTSSGVINITGNVTGGSGTNAMGVRNTSTGTMTITGNATGGSGATAYGANNNHTGTLTITGIATGGTTATASGVRNVGTGTVNLGRAKGTAYGPGNTSGLTATVGAENSALGVIEIKELEYGQYGMTPTSGTGIRLKKVSTNQAIFNYVDAGAAKTLVDATTGQMPAVTDVRTGVSYASGALTGTCAVPPAGSVALGVPVDNTTGTATLTAENVRAAIGLATANLDTQLAALPTAAENADAVWDEATSGHTTAETYGGRVVRSTNANNELQINAQNHAAANVHQFQAEVITSSAFDASVITAFAVPELQEIHAIHGLKSGSALTVTPSSRVAGAISQSITGDGTTTTTVTRT